MSRNTGVMVGVRYGAPLDRALLKNAACQESHTRHRGSASWLTDLTNFNFHFARAGQFNLFGRAKNPILYTA